ncbi:XK-related protein 5a [Pangasianodon hypophthalmus]|uniref:XK-related protein 5a n=1 Tax=Pangasianodon hypophthalmus TaxID=310915 RepID=UPI0023075729|nr:XK-related protein 5a [Pangasianodon hypophthalmus]
MAAVVCGGGGCGSACWQVLLFGSTALVILAERAALICCFAFYLWKEQLLWAGLTFALLLPGAIVQVLSFMWYRADGEQRTCHLLIIHTLHLGIFKRLWDCSVCVWRAQSQAQQVMQQVDAAALRLLDVLLLTLPQALTHTYVLTATEFSLASPVALCSGVCVLSLSWALVLYSRACCLARPGHLLMPPAALLCQLLWRAGLLSARFASLALFARSFGCWVIGVVGCHWLIAAFWLVSQQTDICVGQWAWRGFNLVLGGVHVFLFLNVKDGPSRYRMAGFYTVMLLENATLVLAASDILTEASWESLTVPTAVLCSFLLGLTFLLLYYRFLHPKSTEISHTLHHGAQAGSACLDQGDSSFSLTDKSLALPSLRPPLSSSHPSFSLLEHPGSCGAKAGAECRHHHWLLLRLALKTGDPNKIERAFGAGGATGIVSEEQEDDSGEKGGGGGEGLDIKDEDDTLAPLSDCKDEFESVSEAREDVEEEEADVDVGEEMDSVDSEWKRSSPEGKSVFGDSPEPDYCPTESSSTLYFSADPQSPSSASDPRLDRMEVSGSHLTGPRRHLVLSARGLEDDTGF